MNTRDLLAQRSTALEEARLLNDLAENEDRDLTDDEQTQWDDIQQKIAGLDKRLERAKKLEAAPQAPAVIKRRGDNFNAALGAYLREGDTGGVKDMLVREGGSTGVEIRASNNTDMNIGTAADGGDLVPTGFYNQIIARRSEISLPERLGVRRIPGVGTTVDVPVDNEADGEFITKAEAAAFDQDAPAVTKISMTLVKYTKYITISDELLQDNDANLLAFLSEWVARGQAKTMNDLLLTEVATDGTAFKTTASATAVAAGELEATALNDNVGDYLDDGGSVNWVMRPSTYSAIAAIQGNPFVYGPTPVGGGVRGRELLGYPVHFSNKAAAIASTAKTVYFGNWNFVGWREGPGFTLLRDPYSAASTGQIKLWMYFRTDFEVLQAAAIGYMKQKT